MDPPSTNDAYSPSKSKPKRAGKGRTRCVYGMVLLGIVAVVMLTRDGSVKKTVWIEDSNYDIPAVTTPETNKKGAPKTNKKGDAKQHANGIKQISILGERNSGTRWTYAHLKDCFEESGIHVTRNFVRYKHWFQYENTAKYPHDTLVVAQFRNPYDWVEAMRKVPHHSPAHMNMDWKEFCTKEWTTKRIGTDLNITDPMTICQEHFYFRDIVSCDLNPLPKSSYKKLHFSENQPFYEMRNDGSGTPYANILEMRAAKIRNFLSVKEYEGVRDLWATQYEYLVSKGTQELLDSITAVTGVEPKCKAYPPQNRRKRPLFIDFTNYLNEQMDWEAENLIGYKKQMVPSKKRAKEKSVVENESDSESESTE